jgi:hypothetical protein
MQRIVKKIEELRKAIERRGGDEPPYMFEAGNWIRVSLQ